MSGNDSEPWFISMAGGWGYIPCHWKGWVALLVVVAAALMIVVLLEWLVAFAGRPGWEIVAVLPILGALVVVDRIARGRSKPW